MKKKLDSKVLIILIIEYLLYENEEIIKSYYDFESDTALDNIRLSNFLSKLKILCDKGRNVDTENREKDKIQSCLRTEMKNFKASRESRLNKKMISNGALIKTDPDISFQTASAIAVRSTKELKDKDILKSFIQNAYLLIEKSKNII